MAGRKKNFTSKSGKIQVGGDAIRIFERIKGKYDMKDKPNEKKSKLKRERVIVKGKDMQKGTWKICRNDELFVEKSGFITAILIKTAKGFLEQPVKLLYLLKVYCNNITDDNDKTELVITKEGNINRKLYPEAWTFRLKERAPAIPSIILNNMSGDTDI